MKRQHYFHPLITLVNLRAREAAAAGSRYFIFHFSFPAPLNPQAASSAPAARWRDPSRKRKRKLVQPAGTEEISACLSIFPNPSRLSSPQRLQRKCCHIRGPSRRDGGWSLNSCAAVWRAEWRETLDRARPIYRGIAPMPRTVAAGRLPRVCTAADQRFGSSPS
jgi:hypothetical protein